MVSAGHVGRRLKSEVQVSTVKFRPEHFSAVSGGNRNYTGLTFDGNGAGFCTDVNKRAPAPQLACKVTGILSLHF